MQTKLMSFAESWCNILVGYTINFIANAIILPYFVEDFSISDNLIIGIIYTFISLTRSYCIRRWFNRKDGK